MPKRFLRPRSIFRCEDVPCRTLTAKGVLGMGRFQRAAGLVILGASWSAAALLMLVVARSPTDTIAEPVEATAIGVSRILFDLYAPPTVTVVSAVGLAIFCGWSVSTLERGVATRARRSQVGTRTPLAPKIVMAETRGEFAGAVT